MARAGGYVLRLNPDRFDIFLNAIASVGWFAEAVASFSHNRSASLVCFILNADNQISHIAQGRHGIKAGTDQTRLNVEDAYKLPTLLNPGDIIDGVPCRNRGNAKACFYGGGLLSPGAFEETVNRIVELVPETREVLDRFTTSRQEELERLGPKVLDNLALQKEAVTGALLLADMGRKPVSEWELGENEDPKSFLEGLPQTRMFEDSMIDRDMKRVPGYEFIREVANSSATYFEDGDDRLTVIMANRQPLEQQTGADLIYFNETFRAFVIVQYKAMRQHDDLGAVFRYPEKTLTDEIARMDKFLDQLATIKSDSEADAFRLNENPFFLKFCPRLQFEPDSTGLTKGMYLPYGYWKILEADDRLKGPRGGRRLTYSNVRRHFNNTDFASIIRGAWVGTTISQSELLAEWMRHVIESGRSITFAVKSKNSDPGDAKRMV